MTNTDQDKWNARYQAVDKQAHAAQVLIDNLHLLPASGTALDLACGLGGNALLLAKQGLSVEAWDISPVAIAKLKQQATGLSIHANVVNITTASLPKNHFDVIVISYFLEHSLAPALIEALQPNGLLFYQTFNQNQLDHGPTNPVWRLQTNELLRLFSPLVVRYYREESLANEALLVAQKKMP